MAEPFGNYVKEDIDLVFLTDVGGIWYNRRILSNYQHSTMPLFLTVWAEQINLQVGVTPSSPCYGHYSSDSKVGYLTVICKYARKMREEEKEQVGRSRALFRVQFRTHAKVGYCLFWISSTVPFDTWGKIEVLRKSEPWVFATAQHELSGLSLMIPVLHGLTPDLSPIQQSSPPICCKEFKAP